MATVPQAIAIFDIDGVIRDVSGSYRRAIADTVEHFTQGKYRPSPADIDNLKSEGVWNNDWEATQELTYRFWESQGVERENLELSYSELVNFFQFKYKGTDPTDWNGYICEEKLLISSSYLDSLSEAGIYWGFFSGAPRDEANYVLKKRLKLENPILTAMEDAPGKPDPTGLLQTVEHIERADRLPTNIPIIYAGDTVADMLVVMRAKCVLPSRNWIGVGILPPHILSNPEIKSSYSEKLEMAHAHAVCNALEELTPALIEGLLKVF